jgi:hypothetical protein
MREAPSALGRRVVVTGLAGAGKSTFSLALAARTGLPVIHLDLHFWKPGWVAPSQTEWRGKQCGVLAGDAWIADGNYPQTLDLRLERADTVVFLDLPWWQIQAGGQGIPRRSGRRPHGSRRLLTGRRGGRQAWAAGPARRARLPREFRVLLLCFAPAMWVC